MLIFGRVGIDPCDFMGSRLIRRSLVGFSVCGGHKRTRNRSRFMYALHNMTHLLTVSRATRPRLMIVIVCSCLLWSASSSAPLKFPPGPIGQSQGTFKVQMDAFTASLLHVPPFVCHVNTPPRRGVAHTKEKPEALWSRRGRPGGIDAT